MAIFSSSGRDRSMVPISAARRAMSLPTLTWVAPPAIVPTWMMRAPQGHGVEVAVDVVAADHVEDHVGAGAVGQVAGGGHEVLGAVVHGPVRTQGQAAVDLAGRGGDDDAGADGLGDLDGGGAHPGRPGVHQRGAPRGEAALHHQGVEGGDPHLGDGGGVGQRHRVAARP